MAASLVTAGVPLLAAVPAQAVLPSGQVAVGIAGSDTTDNMMETIAASTLFDNLANFPTSGTTTQTYNIPAFSTTGLLVDGGGTDTGCSADVTWTKDPLAPGSNSASTKGISPFGSTAGRRYLYAESAGTGPGSPAGTDAGCIDVARSSAAPRAVGADPLANDKASFEYYAFALDAVSWATTSNKAPGTLTLADIQAIYNCSKTDWGQFPGGTPGPIQRYMPQVGSGTRSFFISDILAGATPVTGQGTACPDPVLGEENNGSIVLDVDLDRAILPYSVALWDLQETNRLNPSIDVRRDARLGGITTAIGANGVQTSASTANAWSSTGLQYKLDTAGVVTEANVKVVTPSPAFPGIRYVYNVLDNAGNRPGYQAAVALFGFTNSAGGAGTKLCAATGPAGSARAFARSAILSNGFAPLTTTGGKAGTNDAGSTCRQFIPV